jgi:3-methyladenine DNA glycosylase AlkC
MKEKTTRPTDYFGTNLASLLADKISEVYPGFSKKSFIAYVQRQAKEKTLTQRVELIADSLNEHLPANYDSAIKILISIMGDENAAETGMFKKYYWLMPVGKYIEKFGLSHYKLSIQAIEELTKRNTGEYAIRPFIRKYPEKALRQMKKWALSDNFHLRRLASEGLRPKLPWASKLDLFIEDPEPVFSILELLKNEEILFVKKSVANHLTDYIKVNPEPTLLLVERWKKYRNEHTQWMIKHATRKLK